MNEDRAKAAHEFMLNEADIICARVEEGDAKLMAQCVKSPCRQCGHPAWVSQASRRMPNWQARIHCLTCVEKAIADAIRQKFPRFEDPEWIAELEEKVLVNRKAHAAGAALPFPDLESPFCHCSRCAKAGADPQAMLCESCKSELVEK